MAYEVDIEQLNKSIQEGEQLFKEKKLNDGQVKQLANDVGRRFISNLFLKDLKDGECIMIVTYMPSFNPF
jgi:hypothetical protein